MERKLQILFIVASIATSLLIVFNFIMNPMESRKKWLTDEIAKVPEKLKEADELSFNNVSYGALIGERPQIWASLVDKPAEVVVEQAAQKPNIDQMLEGVQVTRFKIGDRIKIITKNNPDGGFFGVGDKVQGCVLKEYTRLDATFTFDWKEGKQTLKTIMPRK